MLLAMKPAAIPDAMIPVPMTATYFIILKPMQISFELP
jgi:hypothetical protein